MLKEDRDYGQRIEIMLGKAVGTLEAIISSGTGVEQDFESDLDVVRFPSNHVI